MPKRLPRSLLLCVSLIVVWLVACGTPPNDPSAANLVPHPVGYDVQNSVNLQDTIAKAASVASLTGLHPELAALITGVNNLTKCFQQAGAIEGRTYVKIAEPYKAGVLVIVNQKVLTDPQTLLGCVAPRLSGAAVPGIQPCVRAYTLNKDNNTFYIAYAATNPEVCATLCSALEGCK